MFFRAFIAFTTRSPLFMTYSLHLPLRPSRSLREVRVSELNRYGRREGRDGGNGSPLAQKPRCTLCKSSRNSSLALLIRPH
jgi:hypothetical protein